MLSYLFSADGDDDDNSSSSHFDSAFVPGESGSPSHSPKDRISASPSHETTSPGRQYSVSTANMNGIDSNVHDISNEDNSNNNKSSKNLGPNFLYEDNKLSTAHFPFNHSLHQQTSTHGIRPSFPFVPSHPSAAVKSETSVVFPNLGASYSMATSQDISDHHHSAESIMASGEHSLGESDKKRNIDSHGIKMESVFPRLSQMAEIPGASS